MKKTLDARGLLCPLPVLRARKILLTMESGMELVVEATDENTLKDFPLFCGETGHRLLRVERERELIRFTLKAA